VEPKDFSAFTGRLQEELDLRNGLASGPNHIRTVQSQVDAIAKGDLETLLAHAHSDVTLDIFVPPEFPWIRHTKGIAEFRRAVESNFGSVEDQRPQLTFVYAEGDTVVLFGREQGTIRATGQIYDMEFVQKFTFRDEGLAAVRIIAAHATKP
jgi:ketosteroid isomerase-like protein